MNKRERRIGFVVSLMLICCLALGTGITVFAADSSTVDRSRLGTVSVSLKDADWSSVKDDALIIYQVAELVLDEENPAYHYTEDFSSCNEALNVEDQSLAGKLVTYAADHGINGTSGSVNENGEVVVGELPLGIYLVVQSTVSEQYYTFNPFLVTIPYDKDGEWIYEVDSEPKVEITTPDKPDKPDKPTTPDKPTKPGSQLPYTGQLTWPIPVLVIAGLLLLLIGWRTRTKDGGKE